MDASAPLDPTLVSMPRTPTWTDGRGRMAMRPFAVNEDQSAAFIELLFDLIFVFCTTRIFDLIVHDLTWAGFGRAVLAFWLVTWA